MTDRKLYCTMLRHKMHGVTQHHAISIRQLLLLRNYGDKPTKYCSHTGGRRYPELTCAYFPLDPVVRRDDVNFVL